ncbi:MAG TPA: prepilin-type N-terminal cleavage/methylation domain-containing protein [Polyangiaceae bacterium]|jgi:type IV pilus assembly protein PilA|nr:prepilin-type N-terminal cleavage/methylation domain-containing protein [Polyangiaceae bacterium]
MLTGQSPRSARTRKARAGFTLIEVMIVVVIVAVLGTLAVYGVRRYVASAHASEATAVLSSIRGAEEVYRQDTFVYLDVSQGSFSNLHPAGAPSSSKRNWADSGTSVASQRFRELGVQINGGVFFSYGVVAGREGASFPTMPTSKSAFGFPSTAVEPFYVAVAKGDLDGNGTFSWVVAHSLSNEVYVENEGQ